jgi:hypothetical protein
MKFITCFAQDGADLANIWSVSRARAAASMVDAGAENLVDGASWDEVPDRILRALAAARKSS